ncbi:unnamed protein product [Caenorhabditis auriculariae]|uniref:Uncharacterized protein n=1 Tax=Caenorhabditis auriculariae TaxID=2777116 RepID=A0A8S1GNU3_9PELO|nr:unnamed protein product [Caenorhabditis auriculariae]
MGLNSPNHGVMPTQDIWNAPNGDPLESQRIWGDTSFPPPPINNGNFMLSTRKDVDVGDADWRVASAAGHNLRQVWNDTPVFEMSWKPPQGVYEDGAVMNGEGHGWPPSNPRGLPPQSIPRHRGRGSMPPGPMGGRTAPPNFRQQFGQSPGPLVAGPYFATPPPDVLMDMNTAMMSDMSLGGPPPMIPMPQRSYVNNGVIKDFNSPWPPPQPQFPQEEFFDPNVTPYGAPMNGMPQGRGRPPFGRQPNSANNRPQQFFRPQHNPPQQQQVFSQGMMAQPQQPFYNHPQTIHQQHVQPFRQPYAPVQGNAMDDYAMWTDEHDEEAKKKKQLKDKGLLGWGDAEAVNSQPIKNWLVDEGEEEDLETALQRCPTFQKLRRRPQDVGSQEEEAETNANSSKNWLTMQSKKSIVPCGWGDLPPEYAEKLDFKTWEEINVPTTMVSPRDSVQMSMAPMTSAPNGGAVPSSTLPPDLERMPWNLPHQEQRNPFFAQHMNQHQQQPQGEPSSRFGPNETWVQTEGFLSRLGDAVGLGPVDQGPESEEKFEGSADKIAEMLRYAVEKGYLDMEMMTLPQLPPTVLDLLSTILVKIPALDTVESEMKQLAEESRPAHVAADAQPTTWLNDVQKVEYDRLVINVVTSKIEVQELSRKIHRALVEAGVLPPGREAPPMTLQPNSADSSSHAPNSPPSASIEPETANSGQPPVQCDFYDYSYL